jgi:hypothetical protein
METGWMHAAGGRDSVPPECLLKASLLMLSIRVRSEGCSASNVRQPAFPFDHGTFCQKSGSVDAARSPSCASARWLCGRRKLG